MISIIVPVYKVEKYLDTCMESIVGQTYSDIEIILVDDGSPDNCPRMCDEWAARDSRIKVVHKINGGLSSARNAGLAIAKGEYIGFVDSDDYINDTMYEDLMRIASLDSRNVIVSSPIYRDVAGEISSYKVGRFEYVDCKSMSMKEYMSLFLDLSMDATVWNKLFKREFIQTAFREGRNNEDYLFMYYNVKALYDTDYRIAVTDKPHYYYRDSPQSICHQAATSANRLFFDELYNMQEILDDLNKWNTNMSNVVIPMFEGKLIHACDQILKYPVIKERRPADCQFVDGILRGGVIYTYRKGRSFSSSIKLFLLKYFPRVYLLKSRFKNCSS